MKRTALWLALPAALITALLYPRFFSNSIQPPSDPAAIDAARAILTRLGIDPAPYTFSAERSFDEDQYRSIRRFQPSRLAALVSPLEIEVTGKSPQGNVKLVLSERLKPIEWSASGIDAAKLAPSSVWLQVFAGPEASCFGGPSTKPGSKDKDEQRWTCRDTSTANREAQFTIERDAKVPREARLTLTSPGGGKGMVFEWLKDTFDVLGILTMVVLAPAAFIYTITRRKRHRDHLKSAVKISLAFLIVGLALWAAGMLPRMNEDSDERIAFFLGRTLALIVTLAPGFALVTGWQARSWLGVSLIAEPRWFSRPVGLELLHGLALGSLIACAATLCAWAASPWGALPAIVPLDHVFSRFQFTSAVSRLPSSALMLFFFFGVMVPWVLRGQPSRRKTGFTILSGISLTTLGLHFVSGNGLASLVASTATIGLLWWAYRYSGLLATLTAIPAAAVVPALALSLARRDGAAFVSEAVPFAAALGVALLLQRFGRTADVACLTNEIVRRNTPAPDDIRPERERLLTEVSLAREAQQSLLPAHPPDLPGYSIAAACIPAGEVGGDLYDYLPFPPTAPPSASPTSPAKASPLPSTTPTPKECSPPSPNATPRSKPSPPNSTATSSKPPSVKHSSRSSLPCSTRTPAPCKSSASATTRRSSSAPLAVNPSGSAPPASALASLPTNPSCVSSKSTPFNSNPATPSSSTPTASPKP